MVHKHNDWQTNDVEKLCGCGEEHVACYEAGDIEEIDSFMSYILEGSDKISPVDFTFKVAPFYIENFGLNRLTKRMKISSRRQYTPTYFTVKKGSYISGEEAHFLAFCIAIQEGYPYTTVSLLRKWFNASSGSRKEIFLNDLITVFRELSFTHFGEGNLIKAIIKYYKYTAQDFFLEYMGEGNIAINTLSPIEK